jgi:hypothetical protein
VDKLNAIVFMQPEAITLFQSITCLQNEQMPTPWNVLEWNPQSLQASEQKIKISSAGCL